MFRCTQVSALCWAAAMIPRDYTLEHPSSALLPAALWETWWYRDPSHRSHVWSDTCHAGAGHKPTLHRAGSSAMTDGCTAVSAHFQTHVGIGSTSAGITAKSWWCIRLQYYFIVSLMAFPFSTQSYTTSPPYRNKGKHWNLYICNQIETITSPDVINTIRGVEETWQLVIVAFSGKDDVRACRYLQNLLQTEGDLGAGTTVTH